MADIVNIAAAEGLPDLQLPSVPVIAVAALVSDDLGAIAALGSSPWGIYQGGVPIVVADTVLDLNYSKQFTISDYPIEGGSFASYNKVEAPFEGRVRFASGGSSDTRQALVESVESVVGDLNLYDVVTPESVYINANVVREEFRRTNTDGGASLLTMDVAVQEVRILSGDATANTADPASADQQNSGTVQSQTATGGQTSAAIGQGGIGGDGKFGTGIASLTPQGTGGIGRN